MTTSMEIMPMKCSVLQKKLQKVFYLFVVLIVFSGGCEDGQDLVQSRPRSERAFAGEDGDPGFRLFVAPQVLDVRRALAWDEREKNAWQAVNDFDRQWRDTALFVGMRRVKNMPPLTNAVFNVLDYPAYSSMLLNPARYRARPVRMAIYVSAVTKLEPGKDFSPSAQWSLDDGPIWLVDGLNVNARYPGDEPLRIFLPFDPTKIIGKPDKFADGRAIYLYRAGKFRRIEIAGIFCKVYRDMGQGGDDQPPRMWSYPVILAWKIRSGGSSLTSRWFGGGRFALFATLIAMGIVYMVLRRYIARSAGSAKAPKPVPTSFHMPPPRDDESDDAISGEIDPLLKAASEQYRREKGLDNGD